mgnify:CR=1 FL=1|jgi:hypothetical protein
MIAPLYTSPTTPSMMVKQYTIDGVNSKRCSGCNKTGTMTMMKMIARYPDEEHVLVHCSDDRCSWGDCKIHLMFKAPPTIQQTVVAKVKQLPLLFNDVKPKPDLFGGQSKQLPSLF